MIDRVAVIGAGQMGNGIAHVFAQSGIPVMMIDVSGEALDRGWTQHDDETLKAQGAASATGIGFMIYGGLASPAWLGWALPPMWPTKSSIIRPVRSRESQLFTSATSFSRSAGPLWTLGESTLNVFWRASRRNADML